MGMQISQKEYEIFLGEIEDAVEEGMIYNDEDEFSALDIEASAQAVIGVLDKWGILIFESQN